jgi:hypothetical protein
MGYKIVSQGASHSPTSINSAIFKLSAFLFPSPLSLFLAEQRKCKVRPSEVSLGSFNSKIVEHSPYKDDMNKFNMYTWAHAVSHTVDGVANELSGAHLKVKVKKDSDQIIF